MQYLKKRAEKWVSSVVLLGCVAITGVLLYSAVQAEVVGGSLVRDAASEATR